MNLSYSVARYVPSLVRGEALNLGVALEVPDEDKLLVRFAGSLSRARLIFPDADVATLGLLRKYFTQTTESVTTSAPVFGYSDLERLTLEGLVTECRNTVFQFSEPAVTVADDARAELEDLYQTFVAPRIATAASVIRIPQMAPARVRRRLYDRLDRAGFIGPQRLQQQFRVRGTVYPWEFDLGHSNGRVDLVQSIALAGPEDAAATRALLLAAQVDDIRQANNLVGRVIAAADRLERPAEIDLLNRHDVEVTEIGSPRLLDLLNDVLSAPTVLRGSQG